MMEAKNKAQLKIDPKKLLVVAIDQVRPNSWNPKDKDTKEFEDVKKSINENGLMGFIIVRENLVDGIPYEIVDGEQRWRACKDLNYEEIVIYNEGVLVDQKAQELTVWWQAQVPFNELSLAKMVTKMIADFGDIHTYFDETTLAEMQKLAKFDWDQYNESNESTPPEMVENLKSFMVQLTESQYDIVQDALVKAKGQIDSEITDSKALEFVCAEYINTPEGQ